MPSKILEAAKAPDGYHFLIHLDTEALIPDPSHQPRLIPDPDDEQRLIPDPEDAAPLVTDPAWLHEITFGPLQPSLKPLHKNGGHEESGAFHHACVTQHGKDLTEDEYLKNIAEQLPGLIELELHRRRGTSHHDAKREVLPGFQGRTLTAEPSPEGRVKPSLSP